jgi:hypothetical protein
MRTEGEESQEAIREALNRAGLDILSHEWTMYYTVTLAPSGVDSQISSAHLFDLVAPPADAALACERSLERQAFDWTTGACVVTPGEQAGYGAGQFDCSFVQTRGLTVSSQAELSVVQSVHNAPPEPHAASTKPSWQAPVESQQPSHVPGPQPVLTHPRAPLGRVWQKRPSPVQLKQEALLEPQAVLLVPSRQVSGPGGLPVQQPLHGPQPGLGGDAAGMQSYSVWSSMLVLPQEPPGGQTVQRD